MNKHPHKLCQKCGADQHARRKKCVSCGEFMKTNNINPGPHSARKSPLNRDN